MLGLAVGVDVSVGAMGAVEIELDGDYTGERLV